MERLGIPAAQINSDGPGLALGTSGITPIQMCAAYAAIANNGYYLEPLSFTKVTDSEGNVILDADLIRGTQKKVYNEASTAYFLVDLLKQAVSNGTGKSAQIKGFEVAGKTGTNADYASVYFAGMTCDYTSVLWIGHDYPSNKLETGSGGGGYAAPLWKDYMSKIMEGHNSVPIIDETPESLGLVRRTICPVSGLLATEACIHYQNNGSKFNLITDWFDYSDVPTEYCDMHVTLSICNVTGNLASDNCSADTVEEKSFVLIRPNNQFYSLEDSVLNKVFSDTWVRTDKSIVAYKASLPICAQDGRLDELKKQLNVLKDQCAEFISEKAEVIEEEDLNRLNELIQSADSATVYDTLSSVYQELLNTYNLLRSKYTS